MPPSDPAAMFARLDVNQDGKLTQDEVPAERWEKLAKADADGDGAVSLDELKAALAKAGGAKTVDPEAIMKNLDANQDGKLTQGEVPIGLWERLVKADADGDGALTVDELKSLRPEAVRGEPGGQGQRDPAEMFTKADKNGDGKLTQDEVPAERWEKLVKADADGDGAVTLAELKALRANRPGDGQQRRQRNGAQGQA